MLCDMIKLMFVVLMLHKLLNLGLIGVYCSNKCMFFHRIRITEISRNFELWFFVIQCTVLIDDCLGMRKNNMKWFSCVAIWYIEVWYINTGWYDINEQGLHTIIIPWTAGMVDYVQYNLKWSASNKHRIYIR